MMTFIIISMKIRSIFIIMNFITEIMNGSETKYYKFKSSGLRTITPSLKPLVLYMAFFTEIF